MGTLFELTWVQVKRHPYHIIHISKSGCSYDGKKKKKKTNHGNMKLLQWIWRLESDYREGLPIARILGKTLHTEEGVQDISFLRHSLGERTSRKWDITLEVLFLFLGQNP